MPRVKKPAHERLNDSINIPVNRGLKRRVIALAEATPGTPTPTKLARTFIEEGVVKRETATAGKE